MTKIFKTKIGGRDFQVEIGEVAKQAAGSALIRYEETAVLSTVTYKEDDQNRDFFPLMVIYQERMYAAGKIPGGFLRREGRPSEFETLMSRLIDRPIRPLFPEGFTHDVQVVATVLSSDLDASAVMSALIGSSIVLMISDLPFQGPIAGVVVGRINNELILNPTPEQLELSDLDLTVAGTKEAINMVESEAKEISEADMLKALLFAHEEIKKICEFQEEIVRELKPKKLEILPLIKDEKLILEIRKQAYDKISQALIVFEKQARDQALNLVKEEIFQHYETKESFLSLKEADQLLYHAKLDNILEELIKEKFRNLVTKDKIRPDFTKIPWLGLIYQRSNPIFRRCNIRCFKRKSNY